MKWCRPVNDFSQVEITAPDLGTTRVKFSLWYVQLGDRVFEGDRLAEVLIPGATYDISSPINGRLIEKRCQPNDGLTIGQVLGTIEESE
jgi:pyruvate/2-oxoglutarate dehydrogenase complex dihydrolipoamide acyltransferase (E2) component